jgi:ATP-binding cassette subfamily F protein uup
VEARRTRSVSRVSRLHQLREQRAARRDQLGQVRLELASGQPSGRIGGLMYHSIIAPPILAA